ncbi:MAG: hypothetical protein R3F48_08390 [Candidatus Zixiibacteriota bacterium]
MKNNASGFISEVAAAIRQYCSGTCTRLQENRLVNLAASIIQNKLWGRLHAAAREQETSIENLAISIIGPLFSSMGGDSQLLKGLRDAIPDSDITLFLRFQSVVIRTASQELFHRWSENDALSARLWRSLHRIVKKDHRIATFPIDNPEWISLASVNNLRKDLPPVNHDEIVKIICGRGQDWRSLSELIVNILADVEKSPDTQNTVRIEMLFSALRETMRESKANEIANEIVSNNNDPILSLASNRAIKQAIQKSQVRLLKYRSQGKLTNDMIEAFRMALTDLIEDSADGGPAQSYFEYLRSHKLELTIEEYRQILKTRFEYMAELIQRDFLDEMKRQFL